MARCTACPLSAGKADIQGTWAWVEEEANARLASLANRIAVSVPSRNRSDPS